MERDQSSEEREIVSNNDP